MVQKMATKTKTKQVELGEVSELVVTKITPKGVTAVIKNVTLNWVFLAAPAEDKTDPLRAQYRTRLILRGGEKAFVADMRQALTQYLKGAAVAWGADVRMKALNNALMLDVDKSLFKQTDNGLSLNAHQSVRRETEVDDFIATHPPVIRLQDGSDCPAPLITSEFYSGVIADVAVFISAYEVDAGRGITMYLNGVRKIANGERIAGTDPFADVPATKLVESRKEKPMLI